MPTLYVVRHGEPEAQGVLLGRTDPPLSAAGRRQMESVSLPVARTYTSPLRRALESARIVSRTAEIVVMDELAEISMGAWDGRAWSEIERMDPELAAAKLVDWTGVTPPGGEPWREFRQRITKAVERIVAAGEPAGIIGHIGVNSCIAAAITGADPLHFRQEYGQVYEYSF
jgi:alpha-ribazole phosphatase